MLEKIQSKFKDQVQKALESFLERLQKVRTGRANIAVLDGVRVDFYGTLTPLNQVANLSVPDPKTNMVKAWDKSQLKAIEKAIQAAGLGLNPVVQGDIIRLPIPALTEDRRKELVKQVKKLGEDFKVEIRNFRREANEEAKKGEKDSKITEDESKKLQVNVQKETDAGIAKVDDIVGRKEKELMEV